MPGRPTRDEGSGCVSLGSSPGKPLVPEDVSLEEDEESLDEEELSPVVPVLPDVPEEELSPVVLEETGEATVVDNNPEERVVIDCVVVVVVVVVCVDVTTVTGRSQRLTTTFPGQGSHSLSLHLLSRYPSSQSLSLRP